MNWRLDTPPAPGVYRVQEKYVDEWYRRWNGCHWFLGDGDPAVAASETTTSARVLPWTMDANSERENLRMSAREMAEAGHGRYAISKATGLGDKAARLVVQHVARKKDARPLRGAWSYDTRAPKRKAALDEAGRAIAKMVRS